MGVARANLTIYLLSTIASGLFVAACGVAVVAFPLVLGREGVGRAMITLTLFCGGAVFTGLLALATRSAARVFRREKRGIASLLAWVRVSAVMSAILAALVYWIGAAFFNDDGGMPSAGTVIGIVVCAVLFAHFARSASVLARYRKELV